MSEKQKNPTGDITIPVFSRIIKASPGWFPAIVSFVQDIHKLGVKVKINGKEVKPPKKPIEGGQRRNNGRKKHR